MPTVMTPSELERYADLLIHGCVAFGAGETLVAFGSLGHRELAVALAEAAYRAGASAVDIEYVDPRLGAAKLRHGPDAALGHVTPWRAALNQAIGTKDVAMIRIDGEWEHHVSAGLPAERAATDARRTRARSQVLERARTAQRLRGTICAWPTEEWAARVYPGVEPAKATRRLARDLLWFCRLGPDDPAGHAGWLTHLTMLRRRAERLTKLDLDRLELHDQGTDLRLKLGEHSLWRGGGEQDAWGRWIAMNVPTEECFLSPHAAGTEGIFRCTRPFTVAGRLLEGFAGEFRGGRLVRLEAARKADRDWLARYLGSFPGADRLGEVALVDASSRIGQRQRTYFNDLLDENAAAHIAFGSGYTKTRSLPVGRQRYGVNRAATHIDVMIGTDDLEAVGVTKRGRRVTLIRDGAWQI